MNNREPWAAYAVCREIDADTWFPENGEEWKLPVNVCSSCPVRLQCLDYAMRTELGCSEKRRYGILGGLTPAKRIKYEPEWLAEQEAAA